MHITVSAGHRKLFKFLITDVSVESGLDKNAFAMGANFGDIDNDGFLDFYLGTGNPEIESVVPNKLFKNIGGRRKSAEPPIAGSVRISEAEAVATIRQT